MVPADFIALPTIILGSFLEGEVVILGSTVASVLGSFHTWVVVVGAVVGTMVGDSAAYAAGRLFRSGRARLRLLQRLLQPEMLLRAERFYARHGHLAVFLIRFAYGTRFAGYALAGASRMPYYQFVVSDFLATVIWVGALVALGLLVGSSILPFLHGWQGLALSAGIVLVVGSAVILFQRRILRPAPPFDRS